MKESGKNLFLGSAIIAAVASSLCCILPVLAVALGLGAFGLASVFEMLRPYLLVVVVLALAFSFYQTYFRREKCGEGQACSTKPIGRFNQIILWAAIVAIAGFAFSPYYSGNIVSALDKPQPTADVSQAAEQPPTDTENAAVEAENQTRKTIVIAIEGMTCEGCASHLGIKLKKIEGVMSAEASYPKKSATVGYNPKQVRIERIRQGIRDAGYKVK